jgi:hypothetical protein
MGVMPGIAMENFCPLREMAFERNPKAQFLGPKRAVGRLPQAYAWGGLVEGLW